MHYLKKALKLIYCFARYVYVMMFAWIFYDKKYLKGKFFRNGIYSLGWEWAAKDITYRLTTRDHLFVRFPVSPNVSLGNGKRIYFDVDDLNNMNGFGNYYQVFDSKAKITIGKGTYIAPNVGIITTNHDVNNLDEHVDGKDVIIGKRCWIGMNSVVLPGVELGEQTIVGAGSVVTKSFKEGRCVIAGSPARKIRDLRENRCK